MLSRGIVVVQGDRTKVILHSQQKIPARVYVGNIFFFYSITHNQARIKWRAGVGDRPHRWTSRAVHFYELLQCSNRKNEKKRADLNET